jgi:Protein of unknown function (DUF3160)
MILLSLAIPIFITADSLLHIYHIQFDQTLKNIEEGQLYDELYNISNELLKDSMKDYYNAVDTDNNYYLKETANALQDLLHLS